MHGYPPRGLVGGNYRELPRDRDHAGKRAAPGVISCRTRLVSKSTTNSCRRPVLDRKADILRANPAVRIRISGHADERGSDEYNLVLGNKRAQAAKAYLQAKGIDGGRIDLTSYGEEHPVDRASTEEAWAKNRRDEFEILAGGNQLVRPR